MPLTSQLRRDYFWNSASGIMASASTVLMSLVVTRVSGVYWGGAFALALAVGQQFQTLGTWEIRTYQATDVRHTFTFGVYHASRLITIVLMSIGILLYPFASRQPMGLAVPIVSVALLRTLDAYEDVFMGEFQRRGRLDVAGRASFFRILLTTISFCVAVYLGAGLVEASTISFGVSAIAIGALSGIPAKSMFVLIPEFNPTRIRRLLWVTLPLALGAFLSVYLSNAPRFAIGALLDSDSQGYFAIIFMPAFTINLLATLLFRPMLTRMAIAWSNADAAQFRMLVRRGIQGAGVSFALTLVVTWALGIQILGVLYAVDVSHLKAEMLVLVVGGAFNALCTVLYYTLTAMRRQRAVLFGYIGASATILISSSLLVRQTGLMGAAWSYALAMLLLAGILGMYTLIYSRRA